MLAREYPELAPVLDELSRDHVLIADAMRRLTELLDAGDDVRTELAGVAALLETHLVYEKKKLVAALNAVRPDKADATRLSLATNLEP